MLSYGARDAYLCINDCCTKVLATLDNEKVAMVHDDGNVFSLVWKEVGLPFILR